MHAARCFLLILYVSQDAMNMTMLSSQEAAGGSYGAAARGLPTSLYLKNLPPEVRTGARLFVGSFKCSLRTEAC